ncbi:MAG TPA: alpha/beta hydrolase, partial [Nocardioidaceae bacterium]
PSVRFEVVPGGHLGMLTGRAARTTTWQVIDEFLDQQAAASDVPPAGTAGGRRAKPTAKKTGAKKSPAKRPVAAKKTAATKTPVKKSAAKKPAAKKAAAPTDAIGANPARRYGSASSRSLAAPQ